jgi:hypothetical protein
MNGPNLKLNAVYKVCAAKRLGQIVSPLRCDACHQTVFDHSALHAHHGDYNEPLEVIWLCRQCHQAVRRIDTERDDNTDLFTLFSLGLASLVDGEESE